MYVSCKQIMSYFLSLKYVNIDFRFSFDRSPRTLTENSRRVESQAIWKVRGQKRKSVTHTQRAIHSDRTLYQTTSLCRQVGLKISTVCDRQIAWPTNKIVQNFMTAGGTSRNTLTDWGHHSYQQKLMTPRSGEGKPMEETCQVCVFPPNF